MAPVAMHNEQFENADFMVRYFQIVLDNNGFDEHARRLDGVHIDHPDMARVAIEIVDRMGLGIAAKEVLESRALVLERLRKSLCTTASIAAA